MMQNAEVRLALQLQQSDFTTMRARFATNKFLLHKNKLWTKILYIFQKSY